MCVFRKDHDIGGVDFENVFIYLSLIETEGCECARLRREFNAFISDSVAFLARRIVRKLIYSLEAKSEMENEDKFVFSILKRLVSKKL